jgi:hypothetical protein
VTYQFCQLLEGAVLLLVLLPGCQESLALPEQLEACVSQHAGWKQERAVQGVLRLSGALRGLLLHG